MAKTRSSVVVPVSPADAFAMLTDPARMGDWLMFHGGWRSEAPSRDSLRAGASVASVLMVKGATAPFDWTIDAYTPPTEFRFSGKERGVRVGIQLSVQPVSSGAEATFQLELGGLPMAGPVGTAVVKSLSGEVTESMQRFKAMFKG